ncbi:MAG TPA: CDP-archaeol synthase [Candidatus Lokiarchaeia archaeon]|nr:CDP-archaeol synthase [Candidatus Lokiarchaeia archaeon]
MDIQEQDNDEFAEPVNKNGNHNSERSVDLPTLRERKGKRPLTPEEEHQKHIAYRIAIFFGILVGAFCLLISVVYTFFDWVATLIFALLWILPGYLSNAGMFAAGRKATRTIDGGRLMRDGRPIFGPGKTWRGLLLGPLLYGIPLSLIVYSIFFFAYTPLFDFINSLMNFYGPGQSIYKFYTNIDMMAPYFWGCTTEYSIWTVGIPILVFRTFLIGYGAGLGDLTAAFFKRRLNIGRGRPFWIVDQMDFQVGGVLLGAIPTWLWPNIVPLHFWPVVAFLFVTTASIHIIANVVSYKFGLKAVPW